MLTSKIKLILSILVTFQFRSQLVFSLNVSHPGSGRIINGTDAPAGKYPMIVSLQYPMIVSLQYMQAPCNYEYGVEPFCSGTIINDFTILTAAHCFPDWMKPKDIAVLIGGIHLSDMRQCYWVTKFVKHEQFVRQEAHLTPDIAIIKLDRPIIFEHYRPKNLGEKTCLPKSDYYPVADQCVTVGWGITETGKTTKQLQEFKLKTVKLTSANKKIPYMLYRVKKNVGGFCTGDSGGPLLCPIQGDLDGQVAQFGIISFINAKENDKCNGDNYFVNVALYIDWIKKYAHEPI